MQECTLPLLSSVTIHPYEDHLFGGYYGDFNKGQLSLTFLLLLSIQYSKSPDICMALLLTKQIAFSEGKVLLNKTDKNLEVNK